MRKILTLIIFSLTIQLNAQYLPPQDTAFVKANYFKKEVRIPMRDGMTLFTAIYIPKDSSQNYPFMMRRTPYNVSPYGEKNFPGVLGPTLDYTREKFIFVFQDVRGKYMSEGEYVNVRPPLEKTGAKIDESTDTWDTVDWLLKNTRHNNGKVGIYGVSYPGFYTAAGIINGHPAIVAASPQAPVCDWFLGDDFHHNGVFYLPHGFNFFSSFGLPREQLTTQWKQGYKAPTQDGYNFFLGMGAVKNSNEKYLHNGVPFWNEVLEHDTYDQWWKDRSLMGNIQNVKANVLTVGGWFDAENLYGALHVYDAIEKKCPDAPFNGICMGPWSHGGWIKTEGNYHGDISFSAKTSLYYQKQVEFPFFLYHLKGKGDWKPQEAMMFDTGSDQWKKYNEWPPKSMDQVSYFLKPENKLENAQPTNAGQSFDSYTSDPSKPVPYSTTVSIGMQKEYMSGDQRFAATRPDVLVYETDAFTNDVSFAGPINVDFWISTSGTDCDLIVKIIDVFPDTSKEKSPNAGIEMGGYQMLVRGEPMRCKFRESFESPSAMVPGKATEIKYTMPDILHTFKKGHRLMIQVQSTWFPLVDRNPQKFVGINACNDSDFQKAEIRIYHSGEYPSKITFGKMRVY